MDLEAGSKRGNHQSTKRNPTMLYDLFFPEVHNGWGMSIPKHAVFQILGTCIAPLGILQKQIIYEHSNRINSMCLMHDLSWEYVSKNSVNSRSIL